jgi:hypothetical protein
MEALVNILKALTPGDQLIILTMAKNRGDGWTQELAAGLGIKPGTLRVKAHRILGRIKATLRSAGYDVPSIQRRTP